MFQDFINILNTTYLVYNIGSQIPIDGILLYKNGKRQCNNGKTIYIFGIFGNVDPDILRGTASDIDGNPVGINLYTNNDVPTGYNYYLYI